jgi:hypothetical protein
MKFTSNLYTEFPLDQRICLNNSMNSQRISHWTIIQPRMSDTQSSQPRLNPHKKTHLRCTSYKLSNKRMNLLMIFSYHLSLMQFPGKRNLYFSAFSRRKAGRCTAEYEWGIGPILPMISLKVYSSGSISNRSAPSHITF